LSIKDLITYLEEQIETMPEGNKIMLTDEELAMIIDALVFQEEMISN
jgi:hypothetical protein